MNRLHTFIINLKERKDRKTDILKEFSNKKEFAIQIVEAVRHKSGAKGLWKTITHILNALVDPGDDIVLICQDDHQFTKSYSSHRLFAAITEARKRDADILCGGISWFNNAVQVSDNLFWLEKFSGLQFVVIFQKFFSKIFDVDLNEVEAADYQISAISENKYLISPLISVQKDYGYSDVTPKNNLTGRVTQLFKECIERINVLNKMTQHYMDVVAHPLDINMDDYKEVSVPAYVIQLDEKRSYKAHIVGQFRNRNEFELFFTEVCKHKIKAISLWLSIKKIVEAAVKNDDDVIVICEDRHRFTEYYSKDDFIKTIVETSMWNAELLIGGTIGPTLAIPITQKLFWVGGFGSTQFLVLFKNIFQRIIDEPIDENITVAERLSEIASNKILFYPFISIQQDFDNSAIRPANNKLRKPRLNEKKFETAADRLKLISDIKSGLDKSFPNISSINEQRHSI